MEEFHNRLSQLTQPLENVDINHFVNEIQQIGQELKSSQEFLLKEIQRLKQDLDVNYTKLNYANELRAIDQITLKTFKTKFQDLRQLLADIKQKETNTCHLVQILRVNTSRLWHIFETATGTTITQELIYEDFQKLLNLSEIEKDEQRTNLILMEKEHGDLLIKMKEIQLILEDFRTKILQITHDTNEIKYKIQNQQQINDRIQEQTSIKINHLLLNTKEVQILLFDYQSLVNEIHSLLKLIFHNQTQIEIHHKSILIYQTKLEKHKQDLTFIMMNRTNYKNQILDLRKRIYQQNQNVKQLENQQIQILHHRQQFHRHIDILETEKTQLLNHQQQLLDIIKRTTIKNHFLEKEIFHSNHSIRNLSYSYRQLIKDQNKQQDVTNNLYKTIERNERQVQMTKVEINQITEQVNQQNQFINNRENHIELYTKGLNDLENCLLTTNDELHHQRTKVDESKTKVKLLTQKMHKLIADEKPLTKEISHYQKQIVQNEINHTQLELNLKQNEAKTNQYKTIIAKLMMDSKDNDRILIEEKALLQQCHHQTEKSKENIKKLSNNLKYFEDNYQNLKEVFHSAENENRQLKQQYTDLTFVMQLLGERQVVFDNQLKPLYQKLKCLTKQHSDKVKVIEQSKSDHHILRKYYLHLRSYSQQLHQSLSYKSEEHSEYLHSRSISNQFTKFQNQLELEMKTNSNHIHYWHTLMISSPDKFNNISKLFLIRKKLVKKSNELLNLKKIIYEKKTLYRYLNQIYIRRQKRLQKNDTDDKLKDQLMKQKKLRNELKLKKNERESRTQIFGEDLRTINISALSTEMYTARKKCDK